MRTIVQIFSRAPVSGKAKTRLIARLGANGAAQLQSALTDRAVATALASQLGQIQLWCTPDTSHPSHVALASDQVALMDQGPGDLGERMHRAIALAVASGNTAVLIGCDCPILSANDLRTAAQVVQEESDAAIIPAEDGGYVLLACKRESYKLFDGVDWGSGLVMEQTRARLRALEWTWHELPQRWDIDRPEDYDRLLRDYPEILDARN